MMNVYTFDTPSPKCPICHRVGAIKPHKLLKGLLTCEHCRERLVVSCSGHYVRDPFTFKHAMTEQRLRQQSHPLARMWRDFRAGNPLLLAALSSALLLGTAFVLLQGSPLEQSSSVQMPSPPARVER